MIQILGEILICWGLTHGYCHLARKYKIYDQPNHRSSHLQPTIRGAGIVIAFAISFTLGYYQQAWLSVGGLVVLSICSYWDDLQSLPAALRLGVQTLAIALVMYSQTTLPWAYMLGCTLIGVFLLNTYNFMDGINGMMGGNSLLTLLCCWYVNTFITQVVSPDLFHPVVAALLVFLGYNFREKALCFAGDIGSISVGFLVVFILLKFILIVNIYFIFFAGIFLLDTTATLLQRYYHGQALWQAHRWHLYQKLLDVYKVHPLWISTWYVLAQTGINVGLLLSHVLFPKAPLVIIVYLFVLGVTVYLLLKHKISRHIQ